MSAPPSETEGALEYETRIAASPEVVFGFFTDPVKMVQWMGTEATLDPRPGGVCRVNPAGHAVMSGQFLEVDPPRRLVFTWGWTHDHAVAPGSTRVVVTFREEDGGTRVVLHHHDLPDDEQTDHHRRGWDMYLARLVVCVTGGDPGPDPNV